MEKVTMAASVTPSSPKELCLLELLRAHIVGHVAFRFFRCHFPSTRFQNGYNSVMPSGYMA